MLNGLALFMRVLPLRVAHRIKPDDDAPSVQPHYRTFFPVGSEGARLRAGHRPPLKLHVRFYRMQLSRRVTSSEMQ
jgi:hypothetical protein